MADNDQAMRERVTPRVVELWELCDESGKRVHTDKWIAREVSKEFSTILSPSQVRYYYDLHQKAEDGIDVNIGNNTRKLRECPEPGTYVRCGICGYTARIDKLPSRHNCPHCRTCVRSSSYIGDDIIILDGQEGRPSPPREYHVELAPLPRTWQR